MKKLVKSYDEFAKLNENLNGRPLTSLDRTALRIFDEWVGYELLDFFSNENSYAFHCKVSNTTTAFNGYISVLTMDKRKGTCVVKIEIDDFKEMD